MNKTKSLRANIDEAEHEELEALAKALDIPAAQIVREGTREKMAKLRKHPKVRAAEAAETV